MQKNNVLQVGIIGVTLLFPMLNGCEKGDSRKATSDNQIEAASQSSSTYSNQSVKGEPTMKNLLRRLLDDMAAIGEEHGELYDTDVKERMAEAVWHGFINPKDGYVLPDEFGMFSGDGNSAVKTALTKYINSANEMATEQGLRTPKERLDAFQDIDVTSAIDEQGYDEFFGHRDGV